MFVRLRFHLASGSTVTRFMEIDKGQDVTKEDIKEISSVFEKGGTNCRLVDNFGGAFIPDMTGVLLTEIDIVSERDA